MASQEVIIGGDNRVRVNPTTSYPARATALITFMSGSSSYICTGWFISKNTIVTAGHCVYDTVGNRDYTLSTYRIYPGRNGTASPYGSCTAKWRKSPSGWTSSENAEYDYAVIRLNCSVGTTTGWYGFVGTSASLLGKSTTISGYPGDKPRTQWRSNDAVRASLTRRIEVRNDTVGGMSGAPVYRVQSCAGSTGPCGMAIHAYGVTNSAGAGIKNWGPKITPTVGTNLVNWRNIP